MRKIEGFPKSLKQLLQNTKYTIHYYQREYMWQQKQMEELIEDLTSEFLENYTENDERTASLNYGVYFMGSVVLAGRENAIIDGQQRLSSLTLLLIYLRNRLKSIGKSNTVIDQMIYSESCGIASFNINVETRNNCMNALFNEQEFDNFADESVKNLYNRYNDIKELFPPEISDNMLLNFSDWLAEKVYFIEIVAETEQDAHKVFVSMNDRGLSLTSTEMLKGFILSEITDDRTREKSNYIWKDVISNLKKDDVKGDETFIKSWLRAQYAETIRETKAGAVNKDFDIIGGQFHKWVREEKNKLGLKSSSDYELFIEKFTKFAEIYLTIKDAEINFNEKYKYIYYNATIGFTLQTQLLLAPICYEDSKSVIDEKLNLVSKFIDYYIVARVTNYSSVDYSTIKNYVFTVSKYIRHSNIEELKAKLWNLTNVWKYDSHTAIKSFALNGFTKKYIKNILARITSFIEESMGVSPKYVDYMNMDTKNPFEIEHITTNHFEWFTEHYSDAEEFKRYRDNIGDLLLLHKSINASLNDMLYTKKLSTYCSNEGNIYTETLGEQAYKNNPRFKRFVEENSLRFKPYTKFYKNEIMERNLLVADLVDLIWNAEAFETSDELKTKYKIENNNNAWVISAKLSYYDIDKAFEENSMIEWGQNANYEVGDFIYIYVAAPRSEISYKCKVVEVNIPYANKIVDDSKYYTNFNDSENKSDKYVRIEMIKKFNNPLTHEVIKKEGVSATFQGPTKVKGKLLEILNKFEQTE